LAPDSTSLPLPTLVRPAVLVIVPENVVPMLSLSPRAASRCPHPRAADGLVEAVEAEGGAARDRERALDEKVRIVAR
jgi:hypothetical protein